MKTILLVVCSLTVLSSVTTAQFPPEPEGLTVLKSRFHENVTISYKEVFCLRRLHSRIPSADITKPGICETTTGVKSYTGYVRLPSGFLDDINGEPQDYPINT
jgi:hypothetical protein